MSEIVRQLPFPEPLYSVGEWGAAVDENGEAIDDTAAFTPLSRIKSINVTWRQLRKVLRYLRDKRGVRWRERLPSGEVQVETDYIVERTDGKPKTQILKSWER